MLAVDTARIYPPSGRMSCAESNAIPPNRGYVRGWTCYKLALTFMWRSAMSRYFLGPRVTSNRSRASCEL
jgi:hypothetical protein